MNRNDRKRNFGSVNVMKENEISYKIRGAIFTVYNKLGPGLFESVYEAALTHELQKLGLKTSSQVGVPVVYDSIKMEAGFAC